MYLQLKVLCLFYQYSNIYLNMICNHEHADNNVRMLIGRLVTRMDLYKNLRKDQNKDHLD